MYKIKMSLFIKMLEDILLLVIGLTMVLIGLQIFLTPDRRKFANEMTKAATLVVMGLFVMYYWQTTVSLPVGGSNRY